MFWFAFYGSCTCSAVVLYVVLSPLANKDIHTQLMQACGPHVLRGRTAGVSVSRDARSGWDFRTISRGRGGSVGARLALQLIAARSPRSVRVTRKKCCDKKVSPRGRRDDMCPPPADGSSTVAYRFGANQAVCFSPWSRRIYVHLWWPAVAKLQAASVPIAQAAAPRDRQTDGSRYLKMSPLGRGHNKHSCRRWTRAMRCLARIVLYTAVDARCDKLS